MIIKFNVTGMTCAACLARVEKAAKDLPGVIRVEGNLLAGKLTVETESMDTKNAIMSAVQKAGYGISVVGEKQKEAASKEQNNRRILYRIIVSAVFLLVLMYFTMGHMVGLPAPAWYHHANNTGIAALLQFMLTLPVVYLNRSYFFRGFRALYYRSPNMDSLIAVGSGAAMVYSIISLFRINYAMGQGDWDAVTRYSGSLYFESAAMILTLITLGKFLESRAKRKTGDSLEQLMNLSPQSATVRRNGNVIEIPVDEVHVGDIVIVRSGGKFPVDGTIVSGRGSVDRSALTGESLPEEKTEGDTVPAAAILLEGYVELRADKVGEDTSLAQIIRLVEEAGGSKAPIARLADKIAGVFVPVVMAIAFVTFVVWMLIGQTLEFSLSNAIAVLVISCPCALGLATPVAIMVGTGVGARMGILFKNAEILENLHKVDTIVLDKTGTLTTGKPAVTDVIAGMLTKDELVSLAAAIEVRSEHPFAKAIVAYAKDVNCGQPDFFETLPGRGIHATINGTSYYSGNLRLMEELGVLVPDCSDLSGEGKTPLYFADDKGNFLGVIAAADVLREDSADAVFAMKKINKDVVMLTGDNRATAEAIAAKAGISHVIANVLPWDKAAAIEKLQAEGRNVLMVGDGINDAPALVTANVGMAIGAGTDIAIDSADVVLMKESLSGICRAIELSRRTIKNIRQNLFWAFFYNCLGIPIAAGVLYPAFGILLNPMIGAAAMSMSSVFVVTNALRLRFFNGKDKKPIDTKEETVVETIIHVDGMMCGHCKARVENVCKEVPGTVDAIVNLETKEVRVSGNADVSALKNAITQAGYTVLD